MIFDSHVSGLHPIAIMEDLWEADPNTRCFELPGGADLLSHILQLDDPYGKVNKEPARRTFAIATNERNRPRDSKDKAWRMTTFLGREEDSTAKDCPDSTEIKETDPWVLAINDARGGFRKESLPLHGCVPDWIVGKFSCPISSTADPAHWNTNIAGNKPKTIAVVSVSQLRQGDARISRYASSWEDTALEVCKTKSLKEILKYSCAAVILFGVTGAVIATQTKKILVFDPNWYEQDWRENYPGRCLGYAFCYQAAIAKGLADLSAALSKKTIEKLIPELITWVKNGAAAARAFDLAGYDREAADASSVLQPFNLSGDTKHWEDATIDLKADWTIVRSQAIAGKIPDTPGGMAEIARYLTLYGEDDWYQEKKLKRIPILKMEKFKSADRNEIKRVRTIKNLILEYMNRSIEHPLSIAVFGKPGSGKSYAIKEIAKNLAGEKLLQFAFNLTHFSTFEDLAQVFHNIRDASLQSRLPLVFWDEFDDKALDWLPYFLTPMQDGKFRQGGQEYLIGRAIFVFAGGTSHSFEKFRDAATSEIPKKGPDFLSRLRGVMDIPDINDPPIYGINNNTIPNWFPNDGCLLRRALLLRDLLLKKAPQLFRNEGNYKAKLQTDNNRILDALICTAKYSYGARSMDSILDSAPMSRRGKFDASCLPPEDQISLHVINAKDFLKSLKL